MLQEFIRDIKNYYVGFEVLAAFIYEEFYLLGKQVTSRAELSRRFLAWLILRPWR
jgi:hypothetical protein